jgi:hypothetical protein
MILGKSFLQSAPSIRMAIDVLTHYIIIWTSQEVILQSADIKATYFWIVKQDCISGILPHEIEDVLALKSTMHRVEKRN